MEPFESAWLKWAWGVVNANNLGDNINLFAAEAEVQSRITFAQEYHPKRHCILITVHEVRGPFFPTLWGLLLGDTVHNFRSALDHLAWDLYKRGSKAGTLTEAAERKVQFPICKKSWREFRVALKVNIPGIRRADKTRVRLAQPYVASKRNLPRHVLPLLNDLARFDKHRTLQPVVGVPAGADYALGKARDCVVRKLSPLTRREVLKPGAELGRVHVKKTGPEPYVDMKPRFSIDPSINAALTVDEFLTKTMHSIELILLMFSNMPQSARTIVGSHATRAVPASKPYRPPPPQA